MNKKIAAISNENKEQMNVISMLQTRNDNLEVESKQIDILMQRITDLGAKNHEQAEHIKQLIKQIELRDTRDVRSKMENVTRNLNGEKCEVNETDDFNALWRRGMEKDASGKESPVFKVTSSYFSEESTTNIM